MPQGAGYVGFRVAYTLHGGMPFVRTYGITASQEWDLGDVLALAGTSAVSEAADDSSDIIGAALTDVGNTTVGYEDAAELRDYLSPVATGNFCAVAIMNETNVFECANIATSLGDAAVADIGEIADLDLDSTLVTGGWGIVNGTSATSNTPNFRIIDFNRTTLRYHVIPAPLELSDVFQWFDAAV